MTDLISRQELLKSIERISVKGNVLDDDWIYRFIQEFPSAQPEPCEDTVSRKAVEEMLKNGFPARGMWEIEGDVVKQTVCETLADALMELESLPSAQSDWDEMLVICDCCGHAIHVKRL